MAESERLVEMDTLRNQNVICYAWVAKPAASSLENNELADWFASKNANFFMVKNN